MMSQHDMDGITARLEAISGQTWELAHTLNGVPVVRVTYDDGRTDLIAVKREFADAHEADVRFIANSPRIVRRLLEIARGRESADESELAAIEREVDVSSPAPWMLSLEAQGGVGGCNVISVSYEDQQPDLYLWLGADLAPDADWVFVANARQDIPALLTEVRKRLP